MPSSKDPGKGFFGEPSNRPSAQASNGKEIRYLLDLVLVAISSKLVQ
jgi:hypothetical protein